MSGPDSLSEAARVLLAVNGGLMRGLTANGRMVAAGATYVREVTTAPGYRLWSVRDEYPAMLRAIGVTGSRIAMEEWSVTPAGVLQIYRGEPPELSLGWVELDDGTRVLGVLGEAAVVEGQREITRFGGWRSYTQAEGIAG
jgi:hypothetical protein